MVRLQRIIPKTIRLYLKLLQRMIWDRKQGYQKRFAKTKITKQKADFSIQLTQSIKKSSHYQNKLSNLDLASKKIKQITLNPNEILSFWNIVGNPNHKNGFKKGRNLINGVLKEDYGGGLCQLSGIIYHLSLIAGLKILERHHHSTDIYNEKDRFTPLGADATVVYGYKDLRVINNFDFPISFDFELNSNKLTAKLMSSKPIKEQLITFTQQHTLNETVVITTDKHQNILAESNYPKPTVKT